jgi:hypothetical protein
MMALSASLKGRSPWNRRLNVCRAGSGRMQSARHCKTAVHGGVAAPAKRSRTPVSELRARHYEATSPPRHHLMPCGAECALRA